MTNDEREALVKRIRVCADELYGLPGEGQLLRLSPRNAEWIAVDLRALCVEVERLREDAERMDWLERNGGVEFCSEPRSSGWKSWSEFDGHTLRAAIDAARTTGGDRDPV